MASTTGKQLTDLRWCLTSPSLIRSNVAEGATWPDDDWFARLEPGNPGELPLPPHAHHFRLGQHFEGMLGRWLESRTDMKLRAANLQVYEGKRTVGEFDFLIDTGSGTWHWEAAVKFYLGTDDRRSLSAWYGPNTADRFDIKFERLVTRQLQLARQDAGHQTLDDLGIQVDGALCFMKGRLFHPWDDYHAGRFEYPPVVNPAHEKGWWLPLARSESTLPPDGRYVYLRKQDWLSPLANVVESMDLGETLALLERPEAEQATHLAMIDDNANEISRGFVVTRQWLDRAAPTP